MVYSQGDHVGPECLLDLSRVQGQAGGLIAVRACDIHATIGTPTTPSPGY